MGRLIFDERDLTKASAEMLKGVDKAVVAAAFAIRDKMRNQFINGASKYKYGTAEYNKLAQGIMVGKLRNSHIKVHALGSKENYNTYKTRFFVGGTQFREQNARLGKSIKPYSKGFIKANDAVEKGLNNSQSILNNYIKNVIEHGK